MNCVDLVTPEYVDTVYERIKKGYSGGYEVQAIHKDGSIFPLFIKGENIIYKGRQARIIEVIDITENKKIEERLKLAASVFTHAREAILITDTDGVVIDVNDTFVSITGYSQHDIIGKNYNILKSGREDREFYRDMLDALFVNKQWSGESWIRRKNGEIFAGLVTISAVLNEGGNTQNYVALFSDITPIKHHQEQLEHIAHYDTLTNLPNRILLADRLSTAMRQSRRHGF